MHITCFDEALTPYSCPVSVTVLSLSRDTMTRAILTRESIGDWLTVSEV